MKHALLLLMALAGLSACLRQTNMAEVDAFPAIYPDYVNLVIPANIAPLNFAMVETVDRMRVTLIGSAGTLTIDGTNHAEIPEHKWKKLLETEKGGQIQVEVMVCFQHNWKKYRPFYWQVSEDRIDPYLSYRLIEPGYEVWNKIQIEERCLEDFGTRTLADNNLLEGSCMNCHIYGQQNPKLSMFHLRGKNGGTILNRNGQLRKMTTKAPGMLSNAVYGNFHPSGRYGVFSTNLIIPEIHANRSKRLEVYDTVSDLVVLDFDTNTAIRSASVADSTALESFPTFSADGKSIYFCSAPAVALPDSIEKLKYSILRVAFNQASGTIGATADTIWNARLTGKSVCHLKCSPDGKFLLYSVADYGTFPIWHREADLELMNLKTGQTDRLPLVNGPNSDSYHSWSSNSRWFVFASKRDDGIYGKPYFAHIDANGKTSKPFVLPQKNPAYYHTTLKSFNIPELSKGQVPFDAGDIESVYKKLPAESMNLNELK